MPIASLSALLSDAYLLAIRFAAPALVAVFLAAVSMSFIARALPQLNMMSVGFPVQISTATLVLVISLGSACLAFQRSLAQAMQSVGRLFAS
jgi:flagellar biosynthetic protein FliR